MFVIIVFYFRQLSEMNSDLVYRSSQQNYCSNSSEINKQPSLATPISPDFRLEPIANNPMYVGSPGNQDKNTNISRQNEIPYISVSEALWETEHVYQEPPTYRWGIIIVCCNCCLLQVIVYSRQFSEMNSDLGSRTGQHRYISDFGDSSEANNQQLRATPVSAEFSPETMASNPMYVVNFSPGNQDKNINITWQNEIPHRETRHINQESLDSLSSCASTLPLSVPFRPAPVPPQRNFM